MYADTGKILLCCIPFVVVLYVVENISYCFFRYSIFFFTYVRSGTGSVNDENNNKFSLQTILNGIQLSSVIALQKE